MKSKKELKKDWNEYCRLLNKNKIYKKLKNDWDIIIVVAAVATLANILMNVLWILWQ